ncbi:NACHT domain-containing protein [Argonema antarcticum]|uniref:NACHT domain-containing protein n=1 Tax=Argonema antarcticum TaxID=2942763 RepID=UPI00201320D3|nr:NACHT domain-containing NTPase [Argonema antarcticum]MCL1470817.1 NACHT domain-containing NTPase [Argonema antarcticum A004/B2]
MTNRGIKASQEGIKKAATALSRNNLNKKVLAEELGLARSTVSNFFRGIAIDRINFEEICQKLGLDWREIVAKPPKEPDPQVVQEANSSLASEDVDALVQELRQRCRNKIQSQCGTLRMLNVPQPIEVDHLYVEVNILEKPTSCIPLEISQLPSVFNADTGEFDRFGLGEVRQKRVAALEAVKKFPKLMMLGKPGSGKTTFLKHLAIKCNKGEFFKDKLPIFVGLKNFAEDASDSGDFSLVNYISQCLSNCNVNVSTEQVETLLEKGKALILLDGLDEVPSPLLKKVLKSIRRIAEKYYNNNLVITCRIAADNLGFDGFTDVQVADFNSEQIADFAKKWFVALAKDFQQEGQEKASQFIQKLQSPENKQVRELAVTPILLNLACLVFQANTDFPSKRSKLYEQGLEILLRKWDETRGIERNEVYRNLNLPRKINLLSHVAYITFERSNYFFEQDKIQQLITDYLKKLPDCQTDFDELQQDGSDVLKSIEAQHGLLVERAQGIYSFSHLTFQEYFTAKQIVSSSNPNTLKSLINEKRWREVFLLAGEMSWQPNTLLLLKEQIDALAAKDEKLQEILLWISQKSSLVEKPHKPVAVRAFYLTLIRVVGLLIARVHTYDNDNDNNKARKRNHAYSFARARTLALEESSSHLEVFFEVNLDRVLARLIAVNLEPEISKIIQQLQAEMPAPDGNKQIFDYWWNSNDKVWIEQLKTLNIPDFNVSRYDLFNKTLKDSLKTYYDLNQYLFNCLKNDVNISPEFRHEIEDTLLLPIAEIERRKSEV